MEFFIFLIGFIFGWAVGVTLVTKAVAECNMVELFQLRKALNNGDYEEAIDNIFTDR